MPVSMCAWVSERFEENVLLGGWYPLMLDSKDCCNIQANLIIFVKNKNNSVQMGIVCVHAQTCMWLQDGKPINRLINVQQTTIMYDSFEKRDQHKKPNSKMLELRLHWIKPTLSLVCIQANRLEKIQSKSVQFQVEHSGTNSLNSPTPSKA